MSREIKFRAWDTKPHEGISDHMYSDWPYRSLLCQVFAHVTGNPMMPFDEDYDLVQDNEGRFVFSQYTGLKDKNGVEIYEGDIVRSDGAYIFKIDFDEWDNCLPYDENERGYGWYLYSVDQSQIEDSSLFNQDGLLEVVGNIYENPELLEARS